jgi:hypothetical protein
MACIRTLEEAFSFKQQIKRSDEVLRNYRHQADNFNENILSLNLSQLKNDSNELDITRNRPPDNSGSLRHINSLRNL